MKKLSFDSGVQEYRINGQGVLRFNPGDPNVYARMLDAMEEIRGVESDLVEQAKALPEGDGAAVLRLMSQADKRMKDILGKVFGAENDFEKILGGVNVMAVCGNGERAITNLLNALMPILQEGAERCAKQQTEEAVAEAKANRAQRRAQK